MRAIVVVTGLLTVLALAPGAFSTPAAGATVTVHPSAYGRVLFDGRGFALYAFTRDPRGRSTCSGPCAKAWPPYLAPSGVRGGAGAKAGLVGTIRRADGSRQVTYAGLPLYYYVGDRKSGQILCQNVAEFGGTWLVVRASGAPAR
jgi:predicted lipoprotein with Yx(FWY)xxD motif